MRSPRLFLPQPLAANREFLLEGERAHYLRTVLRLRRGAKLIVFDGKGGEYEAQVLSVDRRRVQIQTGAWLDREAESSLATYLAVGIAKGERMDWAIQKAVELGVTAIFPLLTEYCNVRLPGDRAGHKREHWQKIAIAACEQSGRNTLPEIHLPQEFFSWIPQQSHGYLLDPHGMPLRSLEEPGQSFTLLIGPEGGLSSREVEAAQARGFTKVSLGPRILRVETAVAASLSAVQVLWG
ncbi:MAG: hypothetical protein AXA67_00785 [Methylothermaceae bacteria B42]|nr:MAG: hypothetical protein AXA67_00785 [Methylothermaceae bacteria B42]HHJ39686.1 16S rRNA (uracil(1498)-N(3))-methyltransferase [Methylothermaceae bacterium]